MFWKNSDLGNFAGWLGQFPYYLLGNLIRGSSRKEINRSQKADAKENRKSKTIRSHLSFYIPVDGFDDCDVDVNGDIGLIIMYS